MILSLLCRDLYHLNRKKTHIQKYNFKGYESRRFRKIEQNNRFV